MLYQIRNKDGVFVGDPLTSLEACEKKIAYESDMDHGTLFYITDADTGRVVDTYQLCEHFECVDNISCENCLAHPNCPLHERLKKTRITPTIDEIVGCKHKHRVMLESSNLISKERQESTTVWLCRDCGEFSITTRVNGQYCKVHFRLVRDEDLEGAGKFVEVLRKEEQGKV